MPLNSFYERGAQADAYLLSLQRNATATLDGDKRVTSENFFQFLACGKEVFLSSLAAIEPVYPDLCLFKDMSVFEAPEWAAYKRAVQEADANPDRCLPPKQDNQVSNLS